MPKDLFTQSLPRTFAKISSSNKIKNSANSETDCFSEFKSTTNGKAVLKETFDCGEWALKEEINREKEKGFLCTKKLSANTETAKKQPHAEKMMAVL